MTIKKVSQFILLCIASMFMLSYCDLEQVNENRTAKTNSMTKKGSATFGFSNKSSGSRASLSPADISAAILTVKNSTTGDIVLEKL